MTAMHFVALCLFVLLVVTMVEWHQTLDGWERSRRHNKELGDLADEALAGWRKEIQSHREAEVDRLRLINVIRTFDCPNCALNESETP